MGKYMRKATARHEVAVMDALHSPPSTGVRTRARTLAVQRVNSSSTAAEAQKLDCLELRSRCLEKTHVLKQYIQSSKRKSAVERGFGRKEEGSPLCLGLGIHAGKSKESGGLEFLNSETEGSFGENNLEAVDRSTRESTPCSLIKTADAVTTPGSSTKRRSPVAATRRVQNAFFRNIPTSIEMEEFFSNYEQQEQRDFIEKYNFDIVNDLPLPGRFEWVKVIP